MFCLPTDTRYLSRKLCIARKRMGLGWGNKGGRKPRMQRVPRQKRTYPRSTRTAARKKTRKAVILSVLFFLLLVQAAVCADLGDVGATYPIVERDALAEIEERSNAVDWGKAFDPKRMSERIRDYRPEGMDVLPTAKKDRVFQVNMNWILDFDIPDGRGGILYPKGFSFNPLDYVFLPNVLVVIDGSNARQVEWFKASSYAKDYRVMLLLCGGSYTRVMEKLKRPAFYADARIVKRFQLKAVPAVIVQKGAVMEVREYALDDKGKKKRK